MAEWKEHAGAFGLCAISALLLRLTFAPVNFWPLAFVALVPWLWALRRRTPKMAFWLSWTFGFVFFLSITLWIGAVARFNPFAYLGIPILAAFLGFFTALSGWGMILVGKSVPPWLAAVFSVVWWMGWEWFRSVGKLGFPFALLGHSLVESTSLLQISSLGGVFWLSGLVLFVNLAAMEVIVCLEKRILDGGAVTRFAAGFVLIIGGLVWGGGVVNGLEKEREEGIRLDVALVQPNVEQERKFASYAAPDYETQKRLQTEMAEDVFAMLDGLEADAYDLVVMPESVFTEFYFDLAGNLQTAIRQRARELESTLIVGATDNVFYTEDGDLTEDINEALMPGGMPEVETYNALFVFYPEDTDLKTIADFRKVHLLPFGEAVPYFDMIPGLVDYVVQVGTFLRGTYEQAPIFVPVEGEQPGTTRQVRVGSTICFESMMSGIHRMWARRGAQLFVNVTNNAWFDPSRLPRHHVQFARVRCAETRLPMLHTCNTGITAVFQNDGTVAEELPRMEQGILKTTLTVPESPSVTLYSRIGNIPVAALFVISFLLLIGAFRERSSNKMNQNLPKQSERLEGDFQ